MSPVVFGRATDLLESIFAEFRRHDVQPVYGGAPCGSVPIPEFLFGDGHAFSRVRRRARQCENDLCKLAVECAIALAVRRLLVVCEVRSRSTTERTRSAQWIRSLAMKIGYECSINGLPGLATSCAVVPFGRHVRRTARSIVDWHCGGRPGDANKKPSLRTSLPIQALVENDERASCRCMGPTSSLRQPA